MSVSEPPGDRLSSFEPKPAAFALSSSIPELPASGISSSAPKRLLAYPLCQLWPLSLLVSIGPGHRSGLQSLLFAVTCGLKLGHLSLMVSVTAGFMPGPGTVFDFPLGSPAPRPLALHHPAPVDLSSFPIDSGQMPPLFFCFVCFDSLWGLTLTAFVLIKLALSFISVLSSTFRSYLAHSPSDNSPS